VTLQNNHEIDFHDLKEDVGIFYDWNEEMVLRSRYQRYVCRRCGKFDPRKALLAGTDEDLSFSRIKLDAFTTRDHQTVLSKRLFEQLKDRIGDVIEGWAIGGGEYLIAYPKKLYSRADAPIAIRGKQWLRASSSRCAVCKRYDEGGIIPKHIRLPKGVRLAGIATWTSGFGCPIVGWCCDEGVREAIQGVQTRGIKVLVGFYGPNAPFFAKAEERKRKATPKHNSWLRLLAKSKQ
jgi:hypothetical protein